MKYKAIIFDLDGVLCSTDEYHYLAWKAMADSIGVPFDHKINNRLRGVSRMASLEIILERYTGPALSGAEKEALAEQKNELYKEYLKNMSPADLPDEVNATLQELQKLTDEFSAIGNNLNQIARYFNMGGLQSKAMREEINDCISAIMKMRKTVIDMAGDFHGSTETSFK